MDPSFAATRSTRPIGTPPYSLHSTLCANPQQPIALYA
jgi:hypothetical protein